MKSRDRRWWLYYALGSGAALFALAWISLAFVALEGRSREEAERRDATRLALWRLDSWVAAQLAREAARGASEYRSYTTLGDAGGLPPSAEGPRLLPSPLLVAGSGFASFHFETDGAGSWTSPQLPPAATRSLALQDGWREALGQEVSSQLEQLRGRLSVERIRERLAAVEAELPELLGANVARVVQEQSVASAQLDPNGPAQRRSAQEYNLRNQINYKSQWLSQQPSKGASKLSALDAAASADEETLARDTQWGPSSGAGDRIGPLVSLWVDGARGEASLCCVREAWVEGRRSYQGFVVDWPRVRADMLEQVQDLFDGATLERAPELASPSGVTASDEQQRLATLPVRFEPGSAPPRVQSFAGAGPSETVRSTLIVSWIFALGAVLAVGFTLQRSIEHGHQRSRFATAVTHELRTPLTTFRMYSEMLAKGIVSGERERREYLETLESEARRLSRLVENVLCHARLEDQGARRHRVRTTVGELLDASLPMLERHALESQALFEWSLPRELRAAGLVTDPEAVGQVLLNVVDNACKYGAGAEGACIALELAATGGKLTLRLRDSGPGVAREERKRIFKPFERGRRALAEGGRGVGLGLALSASLARDLGGELRLEESPSGACFCLCLPLESQAAS